MAPEICEHGRIREECRYYCLSKSPSAKSFLYYSSHAGAQFNTLKHDKVPDHRAYISLLKGIISEQGLTTRDFALQTGVSSAKDAKQLIRFLDEPADYKSLIVSLDSSSADKRRAARIVEIAKQTEDIDTLINRNVSPGMIKSLSPRIEQELKTDLPNILIIRYANEQTSCQQIRNSIEIGMEGVMNVVQAPKTHRMASAVIENRK